MTGWREVPPDRAAQPVLQDERDGNGLGWAMVWCVVVGLALMLWVMM